VGEDTELSEYVSKKSARRLSKIDKGLRLKPSHLWLWHTFAPLVGVFAVFVVTMFDPFDFESVTKRQSANIIYKIYSAHYPIKQRDKISVVLLDDDTLKYLDEPWPPSHLVHGQVLSALLSYKPAAVLVDIFFVHHRDNDHFASTAYAIDQYNEKRVPLFIVAAGRSTQAPQPARPEILKGEKDRKLTLPLSLRLRRSE